MTITATRPGWQTAERPDSTKWTRVVVPTQYLDDGNHWRPVFVTIRWEAPRLSLTGVEGPKANGDCWGGAGQITLDPANPAPGWQSEDVQRLNEVWRRWHLNDMNAGSPAQEVWVREHKHECPPWPTSFFDWACEGLAAAGLHPDPDHDDYRYGSQWLHEDVPDDILDYLWSLPNTLQAHPWGRNG